MTMGNSDDENGEICLTENIFFATLVSKAQSSINSSALLKALQVLAGAMGKRIKSCKLLIK